MSQQLTEGNIVWLRDLSASTSTTAWPTTTTAGVSPESNANCGSAGRRASRVHVAVWETVTGGTISCHVHLLGLAASTGASGMTTQQWFYVASLNSGAFIPANTARWSPDASTITYAEAINVSGRNYERYMTRSVAPGGTNPSVTTYIGFPVE